MQFEDLLKILGEFGRYQRLVYSLVCFLMFFTPWEDYILVFQSAPVDHWCATPEWDAGCADYHLSEDACEMAQKEGSIPANYSTSGELEYQQCAKYNVTGVPFWPGIDPSNYTDGDMETIPCDQGWVYDDSQYESTTVTSFNLVCGKDDLSDVSQTVFYGGYLVGSLVFGILSDMIGRWWTLLICIVFRLLFGMLLAFSPSWWVFTVVRFFQGMGSIATYIILFIIGTEYVGPTKRNIAGILFCIPFSLGYMFLALIAFFVREWRTLQIVVTAPTAIFFLVLWFMPESARWLISVGRYDKAEKIIARIAKVNKVAAPDPIFTEEFKKEQEAIRQENKPTALDLFRTRSMCLRTLNLIFNWMVNTMVYSGLSLNSSNLGSNDYVAFAISGAVEIPAYLLSIFTLEYFGRKPSLCALLLLGGVACLCTAVIPSGVWLTTVAMVGKFGISGSLAVLYLYTAELYPTNIRTVAVGTCSMFARVATMLAPLILTLDKFWTPMPLVIFGSVAVLAGFFTLFLPETRGQHLPETRADSENVGK
ncbi:organic cation transporter protein-like [Diadema setosum]|uniref:organic cation transporter protein-like n=1 Tax=Diadema setosum TaxID=31175 RepID=UPI003B3A81FF